MRRKAILFDSSQWAKLLLNNQVQLTDSQQNHFQKVLRKKNYAFTALSGKGQIIEGLVQNNSFIAKSSIKSIEKELKLSVFIGMIKRKAAELIAQKLSEIGVSEIIFFRANNSEENSFDLSRLQAIAINACEQSFNPYLPGIYHLEKQLDQLNIKSEVVYYGDINSRNKLTPTKNSNITLIIGPEGGWSTSESLWLKNNFRGVSFSANVLRVETAAIVASGILLS